MRGFFSPLFFKSIIYSPLQKVLFLSECFCSRPADVDECATGIAVCPRFRKCVNTFGSYICKCHEGFDLQYINGKYQCSGTCSLYTLSCESDLKRRGRLSGIYSEFRLALSSFIRGTRSGRCLFINKPWLAVNVPSSALHQLCTVVTFFRIFYDYSYYILFEEKNGFAAKMQITNGRYHMGQI